MANATVHSSHSSQARHWLGIGLWTVQVLVAISFCSGAVMKLWMPIHQLAAIWPWAGDLPAVLVRSLGVIDLAGGLGVLLPALMRIKPGLTVLAALGCIALQLCAVVFHATRGELSALPVNGVLIALCVVIAWGRWSARALPIRARAA